MYLIDTNVWLERLLDQERSEEVGTFLNTIPSNQLFITDFAFHSIALILTRLNQPDGLRKFIQDIFTQGAVSLLHSNPSNIEPILKIIQNFELDFDDAYQYALAEHHNLILVSFDHHFDRTTRGKKTPAQVVESLEPDDTPPEAKTEEPPS
ncbi:MAG: type II toxin-antitoxin system VapC family toxin, partial [Candidatus Latescibacteria bacterium]|nr:type II toxin-antitoxin system VapC family toxin [Candidatus Latescibacterota bacterium]